MIRTPPSRKRPYLPDQAGAQAFSAIAKDLISPAVSMFDMGYGRGLIKDDPFYDDLSSTQSKVIDPVNPNNIGPLDHGTAHIPASLLDDDHPQYALLVGRSGDILNISDIVALVGDELNISTPNSDSPQDINIIAGNANALSGNNGANINIAAGSGDDVGTGGTVTITGGAIPASLEGYGGNILVNGGVGRGSGYSGSDVTIQGGNGTDSADGGDVILRAGTGATNGHVLLRKTGTSLDAIMDMDSLTGDQIFTWPDATGTIALTSDVVTDHGALTGLGDDDHTQYALLAGRSGGQTLIGGTGASENLTLMPTTDSTAGYVIVADANQNGVLAVSDDPTSQGLFRYDWSSGVLFIENTYDNASADIYFAHRTLGSDVTSLRLKASGDADFYGNFSLIDDNKKLKMGAGLDAEIYYDATNLVINPKAVGTGYLDVLGNINVPTAGNILVNGANPKKTLLLMAAGGKGTTTAGAGGPTQVETSTNKGDYWALEFDTSTEENAFWNVQMPDNWDGSTITARFIWTNAAGLTTETVVWGIKARAFTDDDALDQAFGSEVTTSDTWLAQNDVHISAASSAITIGGSPAGGQYVIFNVARKTGSDNMTGDARLLAVQIEYGINAYSD